MRRLLFQDNFAVSTGVNGHWIRDVDGQFSMFTSTGAGYESFDHKANTNDAEGFLAYANRAPTSDVVAEAVFSSPGEALFEIGIRCAGSSTGAASLAGVYLIASRSANASMGTVSAAPNQLYIVDRAANNSVTKRASVAKTFTSTNNYVLRFEARGTTYRGYVDGALLISAGSSTHTREGYVRFGIGANVDNGKGAISKVQILENRHQTGHEVRVMHDEARDDILFGFPNSVQYVYDTKHGEWYKRDLDIVGLGGFIDALGEMRIMTGTSNGYVNTLDNSTQFNTANFTGTWTSNWFDLGDDETRKRLTHLLIEMTKQSTATTAQIRIERAEHPDLPSVREDFALYTGVVQNRLSPQIGGRFLRFTVIHSVSGNLEIQQIKTEPQSPRPANRPLVAS